MLWNASWIAFWKGEEMRSRESRKGRLANHLDPHFALL